MLEFIEQKLARWGEWSTRRDSGSLGYGNSPLVAIMGSSSGASAEPFGTDEEMLQIDRAVVALPAELTKAMIEVYQRPGTMEIHAQHLGISVATLYRWRDRAHLMIDQTLAISAFLRRSK